MSYLVFARKYRPASFDTVAGQAHVIRALMNSIRRNKVGHAYLFAGPRGVGKTSISRIFSKALNCAQGPTVTPCLKCSNCVEIAAGTSLSVREIDGASHNSVDNVRDLIDSFRALPPPGSKYKIYIIDEVHMLSVSAFNALLKSLEEPPPHTVFILATTESHKIPETVLSRCQRHDLRAIPRAAIEGRIEEIARQEEISIAPEAVQMIARLADGSMRDAQSLFERVQSYSEGAISAEETGVVLGLASREILFSLVKAIVARNPSAALVEIDKVWNTGFDAALFITDFVGIWRELLLIKLGAQGLEDTLGRRREELEELKALAERIAAEDLQDLLQVVLHGGDAGLRSPFLRYALEALFVRMATRVPVVDLQRLIDAELRGGGGVTGDGARGGKTPSAIEKSNPDPKGGIIQAIGGGSQGDAASSSAKVGQAVEAHTRPVEAHTRPEAPAGDLLWGDFVSFLARQGSPFLVESVKRLSVVKFVAGHLEAYAPKLTVALLEKSENREKILLTLKNFSGVAKWKVQFIEGLAGGAALPESMLAQESREKAARAEAQREQIANHPRVRSLQKAFPGSQIERIEVKE